MVVTYQQKHSDCLQDWCISLWNTKVGWSNTIFHGQPRKYPWSDGSSAPQNKQEIVSFKTHENSRGITGFSRFFHVSRVVLGYPISVLNLNFPNWNLRLQFNCKSQRALLPVVSESCDHWPKIGMLCPSNVLGYIQLGILGRIIYVNPIWTVSVGYKYIYYLYIYIIYIIYIKHIICIYPDWVI